MPGLSFGFENSTVALDELKSALKDELDRIPEQLTAGYLFESDKALPEGKRDVVGNHLAAGVPKFRG